MKNIFMISKRSIAAILILCILFSFAATNVFATSTIEADTVLAEETMPELVPTMTSRCDDYWAGQPYNAKSVSADYLTQNGVNPHDLKYEVLGDGANISSYNIYKDSNGGLWLYSGSGSYIPTYTFI